MPAIEHSTELERLTKTLSHYIKVINISRPMFNYCVILQEGGETPPLQRVQ